MALVMVLAQWPHVMSFTWKVVLIWILLEWITTVLAFP